MVSYWFDLFLFWFLLCSVSKLGYTQSKGLFHRKVSIQGFYFVLIVDPLCFSMLSQWLTMRFPLET
jgi:hypothetical protein